MLLSFKVFTRRSKFCWADSIQWIGFWNEKCSLGQRLCTQPVFYRSLAHQYLRVENKDNIYLILFTYLFLHTYTPLQTYIRMRGREIQRKIKNEKRYERLDLLNWWVGHRLLHLVFHLLHFGWHCLGKWSFWFVFLYLHCTAHLVERIC